MGCKQCTGLEGILGDQMTVTYPTYAVKSGDPVVIDVIVNFGAFTFEGSTLCFYENGVLVYTKSFGMYPMGGVGQATYSTTMGGSDLHYNVSLIMSQVVGSDLCDNFSIFIVKTAIPPVILPTYDCPGAGLICVKKTDGTGKYSNLTDCINSGCKAPVGTGTGVTCPTGQTNLSGLLPKCYPQSDVYIGFAGLAFLLYMIKK